MQINLSNLSATDLKRIAAIKEEIEALESELAEIVGRKAGKAAPAKTPAGTKRLTNASKGRPAKRSPKGAVRDAILAVLKDAGEKGIAVPDLAKKLGMKVANVRVWIYTQGNKVGVKALSRGVFALQASKPF